FAWVEAIADLASGLVHTQTAHFTQFVPALNPNPVFITTSPTLPEATVGVAYALPFTAIGGTPPYAWTISPAGATPPALTLASSGTLAGTPTLPGNYAFFVAAADAASHAVQMA